MKKIILFLLLIVSLPALAQQEWPKPFAINIDTVQHLDLPDEHIQYINTGEKLLTLSQLLKPENQSKFKMVDDRVGDFKPVHVWLRYRLKNNGTKPQIFTFTTEKDKETVYVNVAPKKWLHFTTGKLVPWSERSGMKDLLEIPYTLAPGQEIFVYVDMDTVTLFSGFSPQFGNYLNVVKDNYLKRHIYDHDDVLSFGFFGFMLFAMIFNLFFYYVNREKVYLVFAFLLLFASFLLAENVFSSLVFSEFRHGYPFFMAFTITGFIIMLIHTTRFFFRINVHFKGWDSFLVYYSVFVGAAGLAIYVGFINQWFIFLIVVCAVVSMCALVFIIAAIIMIISLLKKKDKEARLFVMAAMPFIISPILKLILQSEFIITLCGMWTILVLSWGMFARFKKLQEENARVALEKEEERNRLIAAQKDELEKLVVERTAALQSSITELKQTQSQLIQSEKMASLGELTAGIAHEIQNPLNFVNNFSDVSIELLDEMSEELDKGDTDEAKAIATDIKQNLEKIAHHGRRADGIVKGMLQHSRASSGHKEPVNINTLADEYFRLAYHGLRAKDKSFNAELVTSFGEGLPQVNMIPQDIGRVLLNLFTNAFYATQQKQSKLADGNFKPSVTLATAQKGNAIEIIVKDNGTGIPDAIKDKILQPFFTTKPTGEGTGLGLSLSYDIVVKGHNGTIDIDSVEGEGSTFIITLPL